MGARDRHPSPPKYSEGGYIRRLDPDYLELLKDMSDVKDQVKEIIKSQHRTERYLVGGMSDDGTTYVSGVRDEIKTIKDGLDDGLSELVKTKSSYRALAAGVWSIFLLIAGWMAKTLVIPTFVHLQK